jgi:phosphotransferase family enzyme
MQLLAEGRLAQVYDYGDGRVVKLDRPGWEGVAAMEADVIARMDAAGLPVARCDGVVTVDGRTGIVLERIEGGSLLDALLIASPDEVPLLAARFADLQGAVAQARVEGLPDLLGRLSNEITLSGLPPDLQAELATSLRALDDGSRCVCHFDFLPGNVLLGPRGWVVIDWLTVASGPPAADVIRTLLCWGMVAEGPLRAFMDEVRAVSVVRAGIDATAAAAWARPLAAARLAEGFGAEAAAWLRGVAEGALALR